MPRGKRVDLSSQRFGRLTVICRAPRGKSYDSKWLCRCDCGNETVVYALALKASKEPTVSCGCYIAENAGKWNIKHGQSHNKRTPEYYTWVTAKQRCFNHKDKHYPEWGGRGITMCEGWKHDFAQFLTNVGPRPEGRIIDRRNNDGHYSCGHCPQCIAAGWPMNVHWVTPKESAANRRKRR